MDNECNCPKTNCERHNDCEKCEAYHAEKGNLPYCKREKSFITKFFSRKKIGY
ncbi:MAG: hypothetical protein HPY66_1280 [Firmicutes bacterium]|nr:hypothetical protein [Bacillota bacterium]